MEGPSGSPKKQGVGQGGEASPAEELLSPQQGDDSPHLESLPCPTGLLLGSLEGIRYLADSTDFCHV